MPRFRASRVYQFSRIGTGINGPTDQRIVVPPSSSGDSSPTLLRLLGCDETLPPPFLEWVDLLERERHPRSGARRQLQQQRNRKEKNGIDCD